MKEEPELVKRMIRATLRTFEKLRDNRADAMAFWSQELNLDATQAAAVFDDIPKTTSTNGLLTKEAQQNLIEAGKLLGALQGAVDPNKGADMAVLRDVLREMGGR